MTLLWADMANEQVDQILRVLHVYRTYFPDSQGGLEEVIRQICINSKQHGIESRIFSLSHEALPLIVRREEARVYRSHLDFEIASCGVSFRGLRTFRRLVKWADIVHYHFPWPFADFMHFMAQVNKPTLLTYHSDIIRQRLLGKLYQPLMRRFLSSVDRIVCTSPNYFATSNVLTDFAEKVEVVPIGLNENSYPQPSANKIEQVQDQYGRDFFLFVGVLRYYKGLHILLNAIKNADFKVVIVGSGPTERGLRRQANELELDNVVFAGSVDEETKVALFQLSLSVVFPSYLRSEAFGVTLLEGAMYQKPLISTEVGSGTSHVNVHNETGLVVSPGSAPELRDAMHRIYNNIDASKLFGKRARARYEQLFTGELMGVRYTKIYRELAHYDGGEPPIRDSDRRIQQLVANDTL